MAATPSALDWVYANLGAFYPDPEPEAIALLERAVCGEPAKPCETPSPPLFANPFRVGDLRVFDDAELGDILRHGAFGLSARTLARGLAGAPPELIARFRRNLPIEMRGAFDADLAQPGIASEAKRARQRLLDAFFWELTYWKTPDLYEELTAGEQPAPCLFARLRPRLAGMDVLDAGAGSGRATFAALDQGARRVYAVEPSAGLRRILRRKAAAHPAGARIITLRGRFHALPLPDDSVDVVLSYSAFTSADESGGERGLAELRRVTRPGGEMLILWPAPSEYAWLAAHGFRYVALPMRSEPYVRFRSMRSLRRCAARFYANNEALRRYLRSARRPKVPYWLLGFSPPHDYAWLRVAK
jgi:SAM-dependent methyltransferase